MKKTNYSLKDLVRLIKSLSVAEKRHFNLFSATFMSSEKEPLYLKMYQTISRPKFELSDLSNNEEIPEVNTVKKRLFQNIYKSLRIYHQSKSTEILIQNWLIDIEILLDRELPDQSVYLLQKAYKLAADQEKFTLLLQLLEWEKKLNMVLDAPARTINDIAAEEQLVLNQLTQFKQLENIFGTVKALKREYGQVRYNIEKELSADVRYITYQETYEKCLSEKARFYYNFSNALYCWITHQHIDAYSFSKKLLQSDINRMLPADYIDGILEHATACINVARFEEALDALEQAGRAANMAGVAQVSVINTRIFFYTLGYHLVIYNYMGNSKMLLQTIERAEKEIGRYESNIPREARQVLTANLMNAYMGVNNMAKADELWEQLFQKESKSIRRSIYDDLRMFRLFNMMQSKIYSVIPSMALAAHRYYNHAESSAKNFEIELKITTLLQKEHHWEDAKIRKQVFATIREMLELYIHSFNNLAGFHEHYSLYLVWIMSILNEQPFYDTAKAWYSDRKSLKENDF